MSGGNYREQRWELFNKITYFPRDRVRLQNIKMKDFLLTGTVESQRESDDGKILSYNILTDRGYSTTRHRRFLRPLITGDTITEIPKQSVTQRSEVTKLGLPNSADSSADIIEQPRRSSRQSAMNRPISPVLNTLLRHSNQ